MIVDNFDSFYASQLKQANLEAISRAGRYKIHTVDTCEMAPLSCVMALIRPEVVIHRAALMILWLVCWLRSTMNSGPPRAVLPLRL